ncbi:MYND-type domain-containing protein [Aphis craccivora]|uniref:MYND-type domain-containing protein n=1 Tax=Aphis craccivora TaxID=307492 RepID=A0A6G0YW37_APHCR|nr:MYND-type domain-containing protein [Aphis craccivora]
MAPTGHMRAVMNGTNKLVNSQPPDFIKCFAKDCNNSATVMCSSCTIAMYCSLKCQYEDWYNNHIKHCERMQKNK